MASLPEFVHVWTWLPGYTDPVHAGGVRWRGALAEFAYADTYLDRPDRFPLAPELPLIEGWLEPAEGLSLHGCLRDALPDDWGQRVLRTEQAQVFEENSNDDLVCMLLSGSDRFGAVDFQTSSTEYRPRESTATLDELHRAADLLEAGERLSPELERALLHGTAIGGARPKALLVDESGRHMIAKFSSSSDRGLPVVNAEAVCLDLAQRVGITAANGSVTHSLGKDVLLVERFDRDRRGHRFHTVSALSLLKLTASASIWYASYPGIYQEMSRAGASPETGAEMFDRIVFNIAIGNSDDHARNHAAFWDGEALNLTPAYDLAPGHRSGETATQAMPLGLDGNKESTFRNCVNAASIYGLTTKRAEEAIDRIDTLIRENWHEAAEAARLTSAQRDSLFGRQILNPYTSYDCRPKVFARPSAGIALRHLDSLPNSRRASIQPFPGRCNAITAEGRYCANLPGCNVSGHAS